MRTRLAFLQADRSPTRTEVRRRRFAIAGRLAMKSPGYKAAPHEWGLEPDLSGVA
jgi:hypothetical protein